MPVKNYGVWAGNPLRYEAETNDMDSKSPHVYLYFDDRRGQGEKAAINVKSIGKESRLAYWVDREFKHPIVENLRDLSLGFHLAKDDPNGSLGLDFSRADPPLFDMQSGRILPHDIEGPDNDILDQLRPLLDRAIAPAEQTIVYIFGARFSDGTGIHDVHMNQGSLPRFENGVFEDGAMIFYYPETDHFEAVFMAFASQKLPTDDVKGLAVPGAQSLGETLG